MILESPNYHVAVTAIAVLLILLSYVLGPLQKRAIGNQKFFITDEPGVSRKRVTLIILGQLVFAGSIFAFSWAFGGIYFDLFAGGYVIASLIGMMFMVQNILYFRALNSPEAGSGQIRFSHEFGCKSQGNRYLAAGVVTLSLFGLFGQFHFLGASFLLLSVASGWLRRAKKAAAT